MNRARLTSTLLVFPWTLALLVGQPERMAAQTGGPATSEELVYSGRPQWTIQGEPGSAEERELSPAEADQYRLRIVRRGGRYYWASREDRELTLDSKGGDRFIIFSCAAGLIKLVNPVWDNARAPLRATDPSERFDYIEILHTQLAVVIYWGRGSGPIGTRTTRD